MYFCPIYILLVCIFVHLSQNLTELEKEQKPGKGNCQCICNRLRHINRPCFICRKNRRHNIDQRNQQHKFSITATRIEAFAFPIVLKCDLACHLDTKQPHHCHINFKGIPGERCKHCIGGKHSYKNVSGNSMTTAQNSTE